MYTAQKANFIKFLTAIPLIGIITVLVNFFLKTYFENLTSTDYLANSIQVSQDQLAKILNGAKNVIEEEVEYLVEPVIESIEDLENLTWRRGLPPGIEPTERRAAPKPEVLASSGQFDQNMDDDHLANEDDESNFLCPTFNDLNKPPKICQPKKYKSVYKSSFYPIHRMGSPGPSAQMNGMRHILMFAIETQKSIVISNFTVHKGTGYNNDRVAFSSEVKSIPFGLRIDMDKFCEYGTELVSFEHYAENDKSHPYGFISKVLFNDNSKHDKEAVIRLLHDHLKFANQTYYEYPVPSKNETEEENYVEPECDIRFLQRASSVQSITRKEKCKKFMKYVTDLAESHITLPARNFDLLPHRRFRDIILWSINNGIRYDHEEKRYNDMDHKIIAILDSSNWIFSFYARAIDAGGVYHGLTPGKTEHGNSEPPNITEQQAMEQHNWDLNILKDSFKATTYPKFIRALAKQFLREYFDFKGIRFWVVKLCAICQKLSKIISVF